MGLALSFVNNEAVELFKGGKLIPKQGTWNSLVPDEQSGWNTD